MNAAAKKHSISSNAVVGVDGDGGVVIAVHNGASAKLVLLPKSLAQPIDAPYTPPKPPNLGPGFFISEHQHRGIRILHHRGFRVMGDLNNGEGVSVYPSQAWGHEKPVTRKPVIHRFRKPKNSGRSNFANPKATG